PASPPQYRRRLASSLFPSTPLFRSQQHFHELAADSFGRGRVNGAVEGDDSAEGRCRVGFEGLLIGVQRIARHRHAAGVGVLDDQDRKSTRLNSSHVKTSYAVFCLKK